MTIILTVLVAFLSFGVASATAGTIDPSLLELFNPVRDAISNDQPYLACALALVLTAALARRYGGKYWSFLNTSLGGSLVVMVGAFGGALAVPLASASPTWPIFWPAIKVAFLAAGGFSLLKPLAEFLAAKAPPWMRPILSVITWIYTKPDRVAAVAGELAVKQNPAKGAEGIIGKASDVQ